MAHSYRFILQPTHCECCGAADIGQQLTVSNSKGEWETTINRPQWNLPFRPPIALPIILLPVCSRCYDSVQGREALSRLPTPPNPALLTPSTPTAVNKPKPTTSAMDLI
jgi:hypothetical protein